MKKVVLIVIIFMLLYISLRIGYRYYGEGHSYQYTVENQSIEYNIDETFTNDKENSRYYFKIEFNDNIFHLQTYKNFKNDSKIIENIFSFENETYKCMLPIFKNNQIIMDIICKSTNGYYYYYNNLKGINKELDEFVDSLIPIGYDVNKWNDSSENITNDKIKFYYNNIPSNHYLLLTDYKGVVLFNSNSNKFNKISLFATDVYQKKLDFIYQHKYVVADYNSKYRFHEFYMIDIITGDKSKIVSNYELSFDSYIQGIVEDKVYLFDRDSKRQYEIDMKQKKVIQVGNAEQGIKIFDYKTNEWNIVNAITASNEILKFVNEENISPEEFTKVDKIGTNEYGYNFYFKQIDDKYLIYRSNVQDNKQLTYLFTTSNINNLIYFYEFIYFIDDDTINCYSDEFGVRKIVTYEELKFNENLHFSIYSK